MSVQVQERADGVQPGQGRFSFESVAKRSPGYRADVDGLRAVAVLSVLFYHLGLKNFPNGYVGVDVFYVISGYLITSLLARDLERGSFSIVSFYERRMRRIFPALFSVLFFCIFAAVILLDPEEMIVFGKALLATTFFISNFYFWHSAKPLGYFDTEMRSPVLLHTWSLSVEEQFYLFFPLTLYVLFRWAKRSLPIWLLALAALSFGFNLWTTQHKPVEAFYWSLPRVWELLAGALLALRAVPLLRGRIFREMLACSGLAMILGSVMFPFAGVKFPGWFVLLPCVGTALVIYAGQAGTSFAGRLLSLRPVVFVGVISYSLYLWHWPLIVLSRHLPFRPTAKEQMAVVAIASVTAAFFSFEYIERPFRGSASRVSRRQIFLAGATVSVACAAFAFAGFRSKGLPQRYDSQTRQIVAANLARMEDYNGSCSNWGKPAHSIDDVKFCVLGAQLPHKIMFWGDSHVEQLYPAIADLYARGELNGRGVVVAVESGCLQDQRMNRVAAGYSCDSLTRFMMERAQQPDIDEVFIGFSTWWTRFDQVFCETSNGRCGALLSRDEVRERFLADLPPKIQSLQQSGKSVVLSLPFPIYRENIPQLAISNAVFGRLRLNEAPREIDSPSFRDEIRSLGVRTGASMFDPREALCPDGHCTVAVGGVSIYKDESHLAFSQVQILEDGLRQVIQQNLADADGASSSLRPMVHEQSRDKHSPSRRNSL